MLKISPFQSLSPFMAGPGVALVLIVAIIFGSGAGMLFLNIGEVLSNQIDHIVLFLVFLLLFEIRIQNILSSINRMPFIAATLFVNFVAIPVIAFVIASVFLSGHPLFLIGLLIYFISPCTDWFLGFTHMAKGNTGLGASLIPINMIVQLLLYPVYLDILGVTAVENGVADVFQTLLQWFLVPLLLALVLRIVLERVLRKEKFKYVQSWVSLIIPFVLAALVGAIFAANINTLVLHVAVVPLLLCAIFIFFTLSFFLSEGVSNIMRLTYEDRALMTMTTAARNAPLMLALTMVVIPDQPIIYAAIIIGMLLEFPHLTALTVILERRRNNV